jgi:hypothetical protein
VVSADLNHSDLVIGTPSTVAGSQVTAWKDGASGTSSRRRWIARRWYHLQTAVRLDPDWIAS